MSLVKAKITAKGTRTFLFHQLGIGFLSTDRKTIAGSAGNSPDEWKDTVIYNEKTRQLYIPSSYLLASFKGGAVYTKMGRGTISKKVVATLMIDTETVVFDRYLPKDDEIGINDSSHDVYVDVRAVKNPNTKGSNLRYRVAMKPGFKFEFEISWDDSIVSLSHMKNVARDAGVLVGVGDGRAIGFGRYDILDFEVEK